MGHPRTDIEPERRLLYSRLQAVKSELDLQLIRRTMGSRGISTDVAHCNGRNIVELGDPAVHLAKSIQLDTYNKRALTEISRALSRIEDGTYGICVDCGEELEKRRLEALPYALLCRKCECRGGEQLRP